MNRCSALLGEILCAPSLPEEEIATRKGEVITSIRQDDDNPAVRASETLMALLYPDGHPYGRRTKGSIEIVQSLTRDQLQRLHAERFAPGRVDRRRRRRRRPGPVKEGRDPGVRRLAEARAASDPACRR